MELILRIRTFKRGANVIWETVTPGGEGACTLQFLNAATTLKLKKKKTYKKWGSIKLDYH